MLKRLWKRLKRTKQLLKAIKANTESCNKKIDELSMQLALLRHHLLPTENPSFRCDPHANHPLLLAEKTYNSAHPHYNAATVRNFPGRVFNGAYPCRNLLFQRLDPLMTKKQGTHEIPDHLWQEILDKAHREIQSIPHAQEIFEKKAWIEKYIVDIQRRYQAHYFGGWVNIEDALFLYWLVRELKPKTIVQTGVCNGFSTAFMVLALVMNGSEGRIHAIDLPAIFDPKDPAWTIKNKVYGAFIPEGKTSGWIVPEAYRERVELECGDAKLLLPPLVDRLESIDLFYHDSDHTYNHMLFEFNEIRRKLSPGGLVIGDDISLNASLWDFADEAGVPAYNYKGTVGVAFF